MFHSIKSRITVTFLATMAVLVAISVACSYQYLYWYEHKLTDQMAANAVNSCASVFEVIASDDDGVLRYEADEFTEWRDILRSMCVQNDMASMYAYQYHPENGTITYIMYVAADNGMDAKMVQERSFGTVAPANLSDQERRTLEGEVVNEALLKDDEFGARLAWYRKVEGWDNVLAATEYSVDDQRARVFRAAATIIIPFVIVLALLLVVQLRLLNKHVFAPVKTLSRRMEAFTTDRASALEPLNVDANNEIGEIASSFKRMSADIDDYINDIERMTTERVQVDVELDVARRIQQGMVPEHAETSGNGYDAFAISHPARSVGGDLYDAYELDGGRIALVVGDVSGKGIAAALFMSLAQTVIADGLLAGKGPAEVLNTVNARICESNPESMFITALVCVFDPQSGTVRMANAGHMPPVIIGQGAREFAVDPGILLGLFDDADIGETSFTLQPNETMLLYTDGVTEAVNAEKKFFETGGLLRCLESGAPFATSRAVVETVVTSVESFINGSEQFDDVTLLALHRSQASPNEGSQKALAVDMDSFDVVRSQIMDKAPDRAFGLRACLACEEAFANIVSYSGAQGIWASVTPEGEGLRVVLEDDGVPFDPFANEVQGKQFEDLDEGGMGIGIIRDTTREASYRRVENRNVLDMRF